MKIIEVKIKDLIYLRYIHEWPQENSFYPIWFLEKLMHYAQWLDIEF